MIPEIRDATSADGATITAFNSKLAEETEDRSLPPRIIAAGVAALLADPAKGRYWVAAVDGKLVGQIMVTYEWSDWRNGTLWWIQSVYVHPDYRRRGIYKALYQHVEACAKSCEDVRGLRLYVEDSNRRAQQTYAALGMTDSHYRVLESMFGDNEC